MTTWYPPPIDVCMRDECQSTRLEVVKEAYGAEAFVAPPKVLVVGTLICLDCGCSMLYSRRPTDTWPAKYGAILPAPPPTRPQKRGAGMFVNRIGMVLKAVNLSVETEDSETRRVVECTFDIDPFTSPLAEALNIKSLLFDMTTKLPKPDLDQVVIKLHEPVQKLSWGCAPDNDQVDRIILPDVIIDPKFVVKLKTDREPSMFSATLKCNFRYPTADQLLFIANGVKDQHFLLFSPMSQELPLEGAEDAGKPSRPRGKRTNGAAAGESASTAH